jgi:MFS family permease
VGAASLLFYSIGVFFEPFQREFGWNRGEISGALIYLTLGLVICGPIVGWLIDRYGARIVALVSIPLLALTMVGLHNLTNSLSTFYGAVLRWAASAAAPRRLSIPASSTPISLRRAALHWRSCWPVLVSRRWCFLLCWRRPSMRPAGERASCFLPPRRLWPGPSSFSGFAGWRGRRRHGKP